MNKLRIGISGLTLAAMPMMALAQIQATNAGSLISTVIAFINQYIIPLLVGIAVLYFLFGVLKYVRAGGDEEKRTEGRNMMIYGLIAIVVMLSVWGLVNLLKDSFSFGSNQVPADLPNIPAPGVYQ